MESLKKYLLQNNHINKDWNSLNILNQDSSRVGAIDLCLYTLNKTNNFPVLNKLTENTFKLLYLVPFHRLIL